VDSYLSSKPGANTVHHKITSWNLGLEAGVSMEKVDELFNQIPRNRDVVFVQEAWQLETRIIDRMKAHYPYSYHVENDRGRIVGSTLTSLFYLQRVALCAAENNQTRIYWDTVKTCLGDFNPWVKSELDGMKCIFSEQNNGNQNFINTCLSNQGREWTYNGSSGLVILSKIPLKHKKYIKGNAFLFNRGIMFVTIDGVRYAHSHYPFSLETDIATGEDQVDFSKKVIDEKADILVGDLNTGTIYQPAGYTYLKSQGYVTLGEEDDVTWCPTGEGGLCSDYKNGETIKFNCLPYGVSGCEGGLRLDHIMYNTNTPNCKITWNKKSKYDLDSSFVGTQSDHSTINSIDFTFIVKDGSCV